MITDEEKRDQIANSSGIYHGVSRVKSDREGLPPKGVGGVITAYLPEHKVFAVMWPEPYGWITYKCDEETFVTWFDLITMEEVKNWTEEYENGKEHKIKCD